MDNGNVQSKETVRKLVEGFRVLEVESVRMVEQLEEILGDAERLVKELGDSCSRGHQQ